ncbi:DUF2971 domain-containing protein [Anaerobaca lacustris]|uniref:DUF2971 domain-containing protein n=1 Tax=Anaerobaca lacustris TaxID=3044600 RepID=A0AAW6TYA3_9BACT|nr:DUF2971 domain-containing protein [Sedimentisphaerales bacterium M17dextr]
MAEQDTNGHSGAWQDSFDLVACDGTPTPRLLYKYFSYHPPDENDRTETIFRNDKLYFAAPKDFNDPFDSVTRLTYPKSPTEREHLLTKFAYRGRLPISEHEIRRWVKTDADIPYMDKVCEDLTYQMQRENAVFCMTEEKDSILMWAHYAGQHTGFCLEFRTDNPLFSRVRHVIYSRYHPKEDLVQLLTSTVRPLPLYLVTKAEAWAYEKEWRLADPGPGPGQRDYPAESLTGVIFGCRMNAKDRAQTKEWCRDRMPRPALYEAKEKRTEFSLDITPVSY